MVNILALDCNSKLHITCINKLLYDKNNQGKEKQIETVNS